MSFIAGYLLGLEEGGGSADQPLLSLEGINALKTLATLSFGDDVIFEIKEPQLFFPGGVISGVSTDNDYGTWEVGWFSSAVVNNMVASLSYSSIATNSIEWGRFYPGDVDYDTHFYRRENFAAKSINYSKTSGQLPTISLTFSYNTVTGYDDVIFDTYSETASGMIRFYEKRNIFTNLRGADYLQFVKSCYSAVISNDGAVNIING